MKVYPVIPIANSYYFRTTNNVEYLISFNREHNLLVDSINTFSWLSDVYDLSLFTNRHSKSIDHLISQTVIHTLYLYLHNNPNHLIIFIASNEGNSAKSRIALFNKWYKNFEQQFDFDVFEIQENTEYLGVIYSKQHAHHESIKQNSQLLVAGIKNAK